MVKVSIIIPAYNVEKYIVHGLQSCVEQTEKDIEIIVVDDGSSDGTLEIAKGFAVKDERIKIFTQEHLGVSRARNYAISKSQGTYLLFLDSDDWIEKNTVEILLREAQNEAGKLITCECYFVEDVNGVLLREQQGRNNSRKKLGKKESINCVGICSEYKLQSSCYKLFERDIVLEKDIRFDEKIYYGEDGLFTYQYLCNADGIIYVPIPLWNILDRPESATKASYNDKWLTAIDAVNKMLAYDTNISMTVKEHLYSLKAERAFWIEINSLRLKQRNYRPAKYARSILKENRRYFVNRNSSAKKKAQYIALTVLPMPILRAIVKMKR